ncbi:TonB-dependent receptor [Pontiella sulfatireligans]|uniref:Colicin I receptor n=1 Tax=Pontiella sulfatireligans TaxID=2750658 RepID=A0A6C2ULP6_9BACT|nr:TonB-dependent receptor [Pontiella sulfatireligans]VGO20347.1 Colicin I receptor [Pontiella sulfatireligans]
MPFWVQLIAALAVVAPAFAGTNNAIVVSASRLDAVAVDVLDVPASATVVDRAAIERSHAQSMPDLLRQEANVRFRSTTGKGNAGELAMRGFGENSGLRVLVVVDGQKMNRPDMGGFDWQQLPLDDIESIEVLRGGNGVLYGNHALSGVINITTRKGGDPEGHVKASVGSFGFEEYGARYSGGAGILFYDVGVNYQREEGYRENALSWSKNANASLGADFGETDTVTFRISGGKNHYQFPGPLSYAQYRDDPEQSANAGKEKSDTDTALLTGLWESERAWGNVQVNGGVNWQDTDWRLTDSQGKNKQFGYSFSPKLKFGDDDQYVTGGIDLFYDTLDFDGDRETSVNDADLDRITAGPFLWAKQPVSDAISISGGARFEYARTDGKNKQLNTYTEEEFLDNPWGVLIPNPNYPGEPELDEEASFDDDFSKHGWAAEASVLWRPSDEWSAWAGYDRVYRYPALDETASYQGYPLADPLNEDLDPETGNNFEIGCKFRSEAWSASATMFYLMMDDEISYDEIANENVNIGSTDRYGSDLELAYSKEFYGATAMAELVRAVLDGGVNDGSRVPLVPKANCSLSFWVEPISALRLAGTYSWLSSQYQGGDFGNNARKIKPYGLFGLRADLYCCDRFSLYCKVDNVLDKDYVSSAYYGGYYPGSGRAFYGGVKVEF